MPEVPALSFKFMNVLSKSNTVFRLVPNNTLASSFGHNQWVSLITLQIDTWLCNGTPEYEIHINMRPNASVSDAYIEKVNKWIELLAGCEKFSRHKSHPTNEVRVNFVIVLLIYSA